MREKWSYFLLRLVSFSESGPRTSGEDRKEGGSFLGVQKQGGPGYHRHYIVIKGVKKYI